jgi:hypothetical protein
MTKKIVSINNIINFNDIKEITITSQGITSSMFDAKYYPVNRPQKTSGHKGHSAGGLGNSGRKYETPSLASLYPRWLNTRDPSWLYTHPEYFWEGLACSWEVSAPRSGSNVARELLNPHTNKYVNKNSKISYINPIDVFNLEWNIFDWGAGVGLTTLVLSQNFPKSTIYYSGTPCSGEVSFFKEAIRYLTSKKGLDFSNIKIVASDELIPALDMVVGIEIVEHFTHPMAALEPILSKIKVGGMFSHSSFWNSEKKMPTLGHFLEYDFDGAKGYLYNKNDVKKGIIHNSITHGSPSISTAWHKAMKNRAWKKLKYDPYGHKPTFWKKELNTIDFIKK